MSAIKLMKSKFTCRRFSPNTHKHVDTGDIFLDKVSFCGIVKPRNLEIPGSGASFWKRDSAGIRTQGPQLRRLLLYPTELRNLPNVALSS